MPTDALTALADPTRRRVFELVAERPQAVGELAGRLPVSRPAVSQHLKVLRLAGLVEESRVGTRHLFSIDHVGLARIREYVDSFWDSSLAAFKAAVEQQPGPDRSTTSEEQ